MPRTICLVQAFSVTVCSAAAAQHADSAAIKPDTTLTRQLPPVVVPGTRLSRTSVRQTGGVVDAVSTNRASPGPAQLATALEMLPGVSLTNDQGSNAQPTIQFRGFSVSPVVGMPQNVTVFLDGVRVNEPDAQEVNFDLLPMEVIEHAELIRGPSAIFGKNAVAGTINLFTQRGSATPRIELATEAGSFGYRAVNLNASGESRGIDGTLLLKSAVGGGYQRASNATARQLFINVGRNVDRSDVALSVLYSANKDYQAGSLPASWLAVDRRANYSAGDFFRPRLSQVALRGRDSVGGAELRGNAFVRRNAIEQFNVNAQDPNTRAFVLNRTAGATAEVESRISLSGAETDLTFGSELSAGAVRYHVFGEATGVAPDLPAGCDQATSVCEDARVNERDAAVYLQGLLQLAPRLALIASVRADYVQLHVTDLNTSANSGTSTYQRYAPRVALAIDAPLHLRVYGSVANGFRAPAALELACASAEAACPLPFSLGPDPPLRAVSATNAETGLVWEPAAGSSLQISAFLTKVRNEIAFVASRNSAGYFQNIPRSQRRGVEASAAARPFAGLALFGSYTFLAATYESAVSIASPLADNLVIPGDRFPLTPTHVADIGAELTHVLGLVVLNGGFSVKAVASQFLRGDEANRTAPLAAYQVARMHVAITRGPFSFNTYIDNVLGRRYEIFGAYAMNAKGLPGQSAPASPIVERFLTPANPRSVTIEITVLR